MSELRPTDAWGELLTVDFTEEQQTIWDDGWDDGFERGYRTGLVDAAGAVTALFVAEVDREEQEKDDV